ncbi:uncharacterized protein A4U43_C04F11820 [Asparagus officinalis]|uniref:Uncharacterized protein n=1 Tax=Asparagus officinalis TaxID=4686 RepID=A0A5P1F064_ASPOF|nr:protein ODORANT1-like [Asparagus officinalis]ONK71735.1 uncharacterized protein A4U43_C04F11820 [Asparagus officinalis]
MGRSPCCDEIGVKKGPWTPEEDKKLVEYIQEHGHGSWRNLPKNADLNRCGKSCRLRWTNYLRPDIKRGKFTEEEERLIIHLHSVLGNKWSAIATRLSGRTDNEIKNYWNTHLKKKLLLMGIDPVTHRRRTNLDILSNLPSLLAAVNLGNLAAPSWDNALRIQADAAQLAKVQIMQSLIQQLMTSNSSLSIDPMSLLGSSLSLGNNNQFGDLLQLNRQLEAVLNGSLSLAQDSTPPIAPLNLSNLSDNSMVFNNLQGYSEQENASKDQMSVNTYANVLTATSTTPSLVSASPENVVSDKMQDQSHSNNDVSANSSSSAQFEAWEGHNNDDDFGWKDILEQISWSNNNTL